MKDKKLQFKDIEIGEQCIVFPVDGDNSGHGGYIGAHHVLTKLSGTRAVHIASGRISDLPEDLFIIKVD